MNYSVHTEQHGTGAYAHESYMALPFVILASTPQDAEKVAREFNGELDTLLERYPQIRGDLNFQDCIHCFQRGIAIAEREHT